MNTIAAISTPHAVGGISVIRISGAEAVKVANTVFKPFGNRRIADLSANTAVYGTIYDGELKIDDGILTIFKAPNSYTGEDTAEISCHGGIYVTRRVLSCCLNAGAVLAAAGEFTKRALLNGKLSLTQAESVIDIINAQSKQYLSCSLSQRDGALQMKIEQISGTILDITVQIAAWIDYPEEDLDSFEISSQLGQLQDCRLKLQLLLETFEQGKIMREGIMTAIVGKPNVGKSTIMNLLAGVQKSIVTDIAGTTRDIIEELINLDGLILKLSDCAGLRETGDAVEEIGVNIMYRRIEEASLVIAVFDNSKPLEKEDYALLEKIKDKNRICVINKSDLENKLDFTFLATQFKNVIEISANNPESIEPLKNIISKVCIHNKLDMSMGFIANERQKICAEKAKYSLSVAIEGIEAGVTLDATGVMLEEALGHLYELSGKKVSDEVISGIFKQFCVGK